MLEERRGESDITFCIPKIERDLTNSYLVDCDSRGRGPDAYGVSLHRHLGCSDSGLGRSVEMAAVWISSTFLSTAATPPRAAAAYQGAYKNSLRYSGTTHKPARTPGLNICGVGVGSWFLSIKQNDQLGHRSKPSLVDRFIRLLARRLGVAQDWPKMYPNGIKNLYCVESDGQIAASMMQGVALRRSAGGNEKLLTPTQRSADICQTPWIKWRKMHRWHIMSGRST